MQACHENEDSDIAVLTQRLKMGLKERDVRDLLPRVGLSNLRQFLETKVDECYRRNVPCCPLSGLAQIGHGHSGNQDKE